MSLLSVRDLAVHYPGEPSFWGKGDRSVQAVRGVSFDLEAGASLGVVGESGCGKSSLAKCLALLQPPAHGAVTFKGQSVWDLDRNGLGAYRRSVQMVFQDPYGSLNPKLTVGESIAEGMVINQLCPDREALRKEVASLLGRVGLDPMVANRYPREFSGGQRQRIGIARALAVRPELMICDEPVSALDVSVQAQIVNLLRSLQEDSGVAYLFISHDLAVVEHLCQRVVVMYLGEIVEAGLTSEVVRSPRHPYTQALVRAVPGRKRDQQGGGRLDGDVPSPLRPPEGCAFFNRCPVAEARCHDERPALVKTVDRREVACHVAVTKTSAADEVETF